MYASIRIASLVGVSTIAIIAAEISSRAQEQGGGATLPQQQDGGGAPTQQQGGGGDTPTQQGGTSLPQVTVTAPTQPKRPPAKGGPKQKAVSKAGPPPTRTPEQIRETANREVVQRTTTLDQRRDSVILPKVGANTDTKDLRDIESIPQGSNAKLSDVLLQFPGVTKDSLAGGDFHIRNEHANVQFRVNGILLPDGVSGFSQILDTGLFKSMTLITGALPAQYGLRTSGIVDLTTKTGAALSGGSVSLYGGSRETMVGSFEYGGVIGKTDYFTTGRVFSTGLGLENPTSSPNAIHDHSVQGRFFTYTSTLLDPQTRLSTITGMAETKYQIPNNPGQPVNSLGLSGGANSCPPGTNPGMTFSAWCLTNFDSSLVNQNQYEKNFYGVIAWQRSVDNLDVQLAYYNRYSDLHFVPDMVGDTLLNNIASDVFRSSFLNGVAGDAAYRLNYAHTIRTGFYTNAEFTRIKDVSTVEATDPSGTTAFEPPFNILDTDNKLGWQLGAYVQDEWRLTPQLTLNYGLRFDQIIQYVSKNQLSPRAAVNYTPWWGGLFHAGYARYFTPPPQDLGRTVPNGLFTNTTNAPALLNMGSILPERANVYDVGYVQQLLPPCPAANSSIVAKAPVAANDCPSLEVGVDAYYKQTRDLLDDGQFGQAYVLTAFNYDRGINRGVEFKAKFQWGNFRAYTNWARAVQRGKTIVSNQSLFDIPTYNYILTSWVFTDHTQILTGSAGVSYLFTPGPAFWWDNIKVSADMIYGSGLRQDLQITPDIAIPNGDHLPAYHVENLAVSKEFKGWGWEGQPVTVRFDVVNVFDRTWIIRSGSGIGVFAPQYGPRRGFFGGISQKLGDPAVASSRFEPAGSRMYTKAPVLTPLMYNWTGSYVGVHFGGAFNKEDVIVGGALFAPPDSSCTTPCTVPTNSNSVLGGLQFGYNYQLTPNLMVGAEAELSWSAAQGKGDPFNQYTAGAVQSDHRWYDTLTGRLGYVQGPLLVYAKGGAALMNARYELTAVSGYTTPPGVNGYARIGNTAVGWTVGAGLEYLLSPRWSAKAEYEFLDFGSRTIGQGAIVPGTFLQVATSIHEVKAGVNYHWYP